MTTSLKFWQILKIQVRNYTNVQNFGYVAHFNNLKLGGCKVAHLSAQAE